MASKILDVICQIETAFEKEIKYEKNHYRILVPTSNDENIEVMTEPFTFSSFFKEKAKGKKEIKIIDTWIHYFTQGGSENLDTLLKGRESVKILALFPFSDALQLRVEPLNLRISDAQDQLLDNLQALLKRAEDLKMNDKVQIRLYEELPAVNAFLFDKEVYFSQFFVQAYATETFVLHTKGPNRVFNEIDTHFDKIWYKYTTNITLSWIEWMRTLLSNKGTHIGQLHAAYRMYNLDESSEGLRIQVSALIVDSQRSKVELIYTNRDSNKLPPSMGKIQYVADSNILFSFKKGGFFLDIMTPLIDKNQEVVQAIYLHQDSKKLPKASFALLIPDTPEACIAAVEQKNHVIDQDIRNYLLKDRVNILKYSQRKTSREDIKVKNTEALETMEMIVGNWYIYYPVNRTVESEAAESVINPVGKGIITIAPNVATGNYKVTLQSHDGLILGGNIQMYGTIEKYINCSNLTDERGDIILNMLVKIGTQNPNGLSGMFTIKYADGRTGCGLLLMRKLPLDEKNEYSLLFANHENLTKNYIPDHLIFRNEASIIRSRDADLSRLIYSGVYKVYNFQRLADENGDYNDFINTSIIRVYKNRLVEFKGGFPHTLAKGRIRQILNNLYIELKNTSNDKGADYERLGIFIVKVQEGRPAPNRFYTGIFSGLSRNEPYRPLSKKTILEYIGNEDNDELFEKFVPAKIDLRSQTIQEHIPKEVTQALTGQYGNYIGFHNTVITNLRDLAGLQEKIPDMKQIFLDAALQRAANPHPNLDSIVEVLRLAVAHGLQDRQPFEEKVKSMEHGKVLLNQIDWTKIFN